MIQLFHRLNKIITKAAVPLTYIGLLAITISLVAGSVWLIKMVNNKKYLDQIASVAGSISSPFIYTFNTPGILEESGEMYESISPYWWLNSGGFLIINSNIGQTIKGDLPTTNKWRTLYNKNNPLDTDQGTHPQNLFRLVTRSKWQNFTQTVYFKINRSIISNSPNRNESNGILLFNHYVDGDNLYYAGLRVDGKSVIKKKINGEYYTLTESQIFDNKIYNRQNNPNLLPLNTWLGIKAEIKNISPNKVQIKLYFDRTQSDHWELVNEAIDDGHSYGGSAITEKSYAGIRTDFMEVDFSNYKIEETQ